MSGTKNIRLAIQGMHCGACVNRVTLALQKVPGVEVMKVEVGSAEVRYDPQAVAPDQLTGVVDRIGFSARVAAE